MTTSSFAQILHRTNAVWDKCTEWSQNDFGHYRVKDSPICVFSVTGSQILTHFTLRQIVFQFRPLWDKSSEWPPNHIKCNTILPPPPPSTHTPLPRGKFLKIQSLHPWVQRKHPIENKVDWCNPMLLTDAQTHTLARTDDGQTTDTCATAFSSADTVEQS